MLNIKSSTFSSFRTISLVACVAVGSLFLSSCDLASNNLKSDRAAEMNMQDFRDGLEQRLPEVSMDEDVSSGAPDFQPYVAQSSGRMKAMPLVSVSVNQSVPVKDVLFELASQADYDLELDPSITGSIIFTAQNRPFDEVVERISDLAGLRYKFDESVLRVENDTAYNKTYKIDYLSYIRSNKGSVRNDIAVVSGDGADTGSSFESTSESVADFWGELEGGMTQILGSAAVSLRTSTTPKITAVPVSEDPDATDGAVVRVESLPVEDDSAMEEQVEQAPSNFSINKQAGLVNVYATQRQHGEISEYLTAVRRSATSQVLIEAKILEVALNDEYRTGIDWRAVDFSGDLSLGYVANGLNDFLTGGIGQTGAQLAQNSNFFISQTGNDFSAAIQAISGFGSVRALASPRLTVLNNQSAVLNVATNRVFFEIDIDVTVDEGTQQTDIDSDIRNVPEGILVNVQPSINLDDNTVSLAVRPTVTRVTDEVADPAVQFITASAGITGVESNIPVLNVQEIDSVIQVRSGQPVVMGGLLQDRSTTNEEGVPVLSEVPMFGSLFKQHDDLIQKTELVVFLKATILELPEQSIDNTDRDLYRSFSGDRRPFRM
jgi:general secretion pathway protein D